MYSTVSCFVCLLSDSFSTIQVNKWWFRNRRSWSVWRNSLPIGLKKLKKSTEILIQDGIFSKHYGPHIISTWTGPNVPRLMRDLKLSRQWSYSSMFSGLWRILHAVITQKTSTWGLKCYEGLSKFSIFLDKCYPYPKYLLYVVFIRNVFCVVYSLYMAWFVCI